MTAPISSEVDTLKHILGHCMCSDKDMTCWYWRHSNDTGADPDHQLDKDQEAAIESLMRNALIDELEAIDTHYWGDDDIDTLVDSAINNYVQDRIAELRAALKNGGKQ